MPGCVSHFQSPSKDELIGEVGAHAAAHHGVTELTPSLLRTIESKMVMSA